jgi:TRAP-type C4-dicarboxylate transport system permease large subunit
MGTAFGIDPVHLGVIFLANLEMGFLLPPVGLNLFLTSSRFNQPLTSLYRHVLPFLLITGVGVLLITYLPWMSLGVLEMLGKR